MDYAKWDALDSSDDDASKPKPQAVRKQAVRTSAAEEREAEAAHARLAAAEAERLQEKLESLGQRPDDIAVEGDEETNATEAAVAAGADGAVSPSGSPGQQANARRRRLDHVREVEEERAWQVTQATKEEEAASRKAEAAMAARELEEARAADEAREAEAAKAREAARNVNAVLLDGEEVSTRSSLRRLKQLEPGTAGAIEQECGVSLKSCDGFRLTLPNAGSRLKKQTRVLIIAAGNSFLCKASASAKDEAAIEDGTSAAADAAAQGTASETAAETAAAETAAAEIAAAATGSTSADAAMAAAACDTHDEAPTAAGEAPASAAAETAAGECMATEASGSADQAPTAATESAAAENASQKSYEEDFDEYDEDEFEEDDTADEAATAAAGVSTAEAGEAGEPNQARGERSQVADDPGSCSIGGQDSVQVELRFCRARPGRGALARKLGKVPVLHISVISDGLREGLEFIGVHQRQYFVEDPSTDAIAQNLNQSLLKVSLEFLFHPSRTRYVKETVVLRECSDSAEVVEVRETMMPIMAEQVRAANDKIQNVLLDFRPSQATAPAASHMASAAELRSQRSFIILDEDMLKVAPQKDSVTRRPKNSSFRGLGRGFLNTSKAKKKGILEAGNANAAEATPASALPGPQNAGQESAATSADQAGANSALESTIEDSAAAAAESSEAASERKRHSDAASSSSQPPVNTEHDDRRKLLLGSADVAVKVSSEITEFARLADRFPAAARLGETVAPIPEEEEPLDEDQGPASISELANQLFGDGSEPARDGRLGPGMLTDIGDGLEDVQTESTKTPSPKASSRGGGAPSERSEPATEDNCSVDAVDASSAPAAGLRLLQQRRKGRVASPKAAEEEQSKATSSEVKDESDDLVNLWMKQRW